MNRSPTVVTRCHACCHIRNSYIRLSRRCHSLSLLSRKMFFASEVVKVTEYDNAMTTLVTTP